MVRPLTKIDRAVTCVVCDVICWPILDILDIGILGCLFLSLPVSLDPLPILSLLVGQCPTSKIAPEPMR